MRALFLCVFACFLEVLVPRMVSAQIPTPPCGIAPSIITITPEGTAHFEIVARSWSWSAGACLPDSGAFVEVEFGPEADNLVAWGPGQVHPIVSGISDADGKISFNIKGAGCVPRDIPNATRPTVQIRANGIVIDEVGINSPDAVNNAGKLPLQLGHNTCESGITKVSLSDAVFHSPAIKQGLVEPCSRFTGPVSEPVTVSDALFLTPYIKAGAVMTCQ